MIASGAIRIRISTRVSDRGTSAAEVAEADDAPRAERIRTPTIPSAVLQQPPIGARRAHRGEHDGALQANRDEPGQARVGRRELKRERGDDRQKDAGEGAAGIREIAIDEGPERRSHALIVATAPDIERATSPRECENRSVSVLIVNADDYGYHPAYDAGILEAAGAGALDAVSAMVTRPGLAGPPARHRGRDRPAPRAGPGRRQPCRAGTGATVRPLRGGVRAPAGLRRRPPPLPPATRACARRAPVSPPHAAFRCGRSQRRTGS